MSRISASSKVNKLAIELDINTDIYPIQEGAFYSFVLATSVNSDGSDGFDIVKYENKKDSDASGMGALIDLYEYVMHGKIFKYQLDEAEKQM